MKFFMMAALLLAGFATQSFAVENCPYEVPVPANLAAYKCFKVKFVDMELKDDIIDLDYALPELLVGKGGQRIRLLGVYNPEEKVQKLRGDHGEADCTLLEDGTSDCLVNYVRLRNDEESSEKLLKEMKISEFDKSQIREVRMIFQHQAMGIIRGPLVRKPENP